MATMSERVRRMIEGFIPEWQSGKNIPEIAEIYRVTPRTIYDRLQEIADKNGYKREELLEKPNKPHCKRGLSQLKKQTDFSIDEIPEEWEELVNQVKLVISEINEALKC